MLKVAPDKFKAFVAIIFPIGMILFIIISLLAQGYSFGEIPSVVTDGRLTIIDVAIGLAGFTFWILAFWPSAFIALKERYILRDIGDTIWLSTGNIRLKKREIITVRYHPFAWRKKISFETKGGKRHNQIALFLKGDAHKIVEYIIIELKNYDTSSETIQK